MSKEIKNSFNILEGEKIKTAKLRKHSKYDDENYLDIEFESGKKVCIVGSYGDYTGESFDEYVQTIRLEKFGFEDE